MVILALALSGTACSKKENPSVDLAAAVLNAVTSATEITVKSYDSNQKATLVKGNENFTAIINYFAKYKAERTQPRYQEIGGKQEEIAIPYVVNFNLSFKLNDGSTLVFDYGYDKIWFTTKDMIYAGTVDLGMNDILLKTITK